MADDPVAVDGRSEYERFEDLARRLAQVPKPQLDAARDRAEQRKRRKMDPPKEAE